MHISHWAYKNTFYDGIPISPFDLVRLYTQMSYATRLQSERYYC